MNEDKWIQQLRDKLADREVPAPEGLWADIEAALPKAPVGQAKQQTLLMPLRRWAIAASFAALLAGGGYLWWKADQQSTDGPELSATSSVVTPKTPRTPNNPLSEPEQPQPASERLLPTGEPMLPKAPQPLSEEPLAQPDNALAQKESPKPVSETARSQEKAKEEKSVEETTRQLDNQIAMLTPKQRRMATIGLYASNGLSDQQRANGVRMSNEMAERYDMTPYLPVSGVRTRAAGEIIYLVGYEERQKHYQPISFGLSVGYPLSSRLSLSTGVVYTRLRSDFTTVMYDMALTRQQTLHYLGIPINAQYRLWHTGHLNVYLSAGGQADYNIKVRSVTSGVEQQIARDRWQFSVQGAAGIQYDVLLQLGLYAEPGVKYYFDNGSQMSNFFKDKPLNLNLQVGLRLNITK